MSRVDASARTKLTAIVAPAGWGKTVLAAQWARSRPHAPVWIDFSGDDAPAAVAASLRDAVTASGAVGDDAPPSALDDDFVTRTVERLAGLAEADFVFDRVDVLEPAVRERIGALIEHAPPQVHFVVTARAHAMFPATIARLQTRDEVGYVRPRDLAFDRADARAATRDIIGRDIASASLEALLTHTGGWPAAVCLAAVDARSADDVDAAIEQFRGANHIFREYVRAEILNDFAAPVRQFLMRSAVPERFSVGLASFLTARADSEEIIELIDRYELTEQFEYDAGWRMLRPCLRDALIAELHAEAPDAESRSLALAAEWHAREGSVPDLDQAARYLIAVQDWPALLEHVEKYARRMHERGATRVALSWLLAVPEGLRRAEPGTTIAEAALLTLVGDTDRAENVIRTLGDRLTLDPQVRVAVETIRVVWVVAHLPPQQAIEAADAVVSLIDSLPAGITYTMANLVTTEQSRNIATYGRASAYFDLARVDEARALLEQELETGDMLPISRLHRVGLLAHLEGLFGSLVVATHHVDRANTIARTALIADHPYLMSAEIARVHVLIARNHIDRARAALSFAQELTERAGFEVFFLRVALERAWLALVDHTVRHGLAVLDSVIVDASLRPVLAARAQALAARLLLAGGDAHAAEVRLAFDTHPRIPDGASVAVQLALHRRDEAAARRVLADWPMLGQPQSDVTHAVWSSAVEHACGNAPVALDGLAVIEPSLEREGHARLLLDAGADVRRLMTAYARREPGGYVASLLRFPSATDVSVPPFSDRPVLSPRERAVLGYLADRMTYSEIAERLFISQNTVKSHAKSAYMKLEARGRREAVARAEELGLF